MSLRICALLLVGAVCVLSSTIKPDHEHSKKILTLSGTCPEFTPFPGVEISKLSGDWFVLKYAKVGIEREDKTTTDSPKRCFRKTLAFTPEGHMSATMFFTRADKEDSHASSGVPVEGKPGKFSVISPDYPGKTAYMTVLDTDYANYAVCLLCKEEAGNHGYIINVVSRQKTLEPTFFEKATAALTAAKITTELTTAEQTC